MTAKTSKSTREKPTRHIDERLKDQIKAGELLIESLDEMIPQSANERREYNAKIALFYESVFRRQLEKMVLLQQSDLAKFGLSEDMTLFLRANINVLNLIDDWFRERRAEHIGDVEEIRRNEVENKESEEITRLKEIAG